MMIGNAFEYEMACNGISFLMYELLSASGIETRIVQGEDHFYNLVSLKSIGEETTDPNVKTDWIIVDVTTDILLKETHGATGKPLNEYLSYVSRTGRYFATPIEKERIDAIGLDKDLLSKILK